MTKEEAKALHLEPSSRKILEQVQKQLDSVVAIQCENGNWNYSPYMMGLANGLIMAQAWAHGKNDVNFLSDPGEWLQDRHVGGLETTDTHLLMEVAERVFKEGDKHAG